MSDSPWSLSRREVLAALVAVGVVPLVGAAPIIPASRPAPKMLDRAMRWIQLALVEKDPATFDPDWWLDLFKRVHADGACISAGGMCAFYPTDVPFHHRSEFLGDKDTFGYLVKGCRKLNMTVVARVDPHCIRDDAAKAHPEWAAVNANGQKARHMVIQDRWLSCALGPCNFEFMPRVLSEIVSRYGVDALMKKIRAPAQRESLQGLRDYLVARLDLLDCRTALARGYDIGSGPTEAMCKILTLRLKRPGMRWDRDHAAAMMNLTALYDSGQAKAYWTAAA